MSATRRRFAALAFVTIAISAPALAEDGGSNLGERLFHQGRAALTKGSYDAALSYFEESQRIEPTLGTLLNIAICEEKLGKLTGALSHLEEGLRSAAHGDRRRPLIADRIAQLRARVPSLTLRVDHLFDAAIRVTLDDRKLEASDFGKPIRLDPGNHSIRCWMGTERRCSRTLTMAEGEELVHVLTLDLPLDAKASGAADAGTGALLPPAPRGRPTTAYVIGGFGLAAVVTGLIAGAGVLRQKDIYRDHCDSLGCDEVGLAAARRGKTLSLISTLTTAAGVVAIGGSAYLLLASSPVSHGPGASLSFVGSF